MENLIRELLLPKLEMTIFKESGNKNSIKQLIATEIKLPLNIVKTGKNSVTIKNEGREYYFTNKSNVIPQNQDYVLLTNIVPTKERIEMSQIIIKKWLKHPGMKIYSPNEVVNSWKNDFYFKEEEPSKNIPGLRQPQISALHSILGHLIIPLDRAVVVMPTGTGKTETMLATLISFQCERLLVTVPSDSLRDQISNKFITLGLLKQFEVVGEKSLYPIVGVIKNKFDSKESLGIFVNRCNVVVTTMSWLTGQPIADQELIASAFSQIFIDEAHHVKASSWSDLRDKFKKEKILQFTATPFRNDGKRLDGKIVSNFTLRKAQEQGYYKKIEFVPIREYDTNKADAKIAEIAVDLLKRDIANGYNHILMARCATKQRAEEIFKLYKNHVALNPVVIYSGKQNLKENYKKIVSKEAKIIVCVDMLGEGFDLPELKIAAFHDIRKSLPITLQLAGRFTRTKYDEELGDASFIANIADINVRKELEDLYAADSDWNQILSDASYERINEEIEFKDFMAGFIRLSDSNIPFQNIKPKLSTVVYKNKTNGWNPTNFYNGIIGYEDFHFKFHDINWDEKIIVVITGKSLDIDWVNYKDIFNIQWDIFIVFWDIKNNLLFINSSDNSSVYRELAQAIIGEEAELIKGINVFKSFYNIKRVKLQNVGLRQFLGKNIRFRMMIGSDVAEALSLAEKQRGEKAFVMGSGFENGKPVNIGASYKGRIWTKLIGDLKDYKYWCLALGEKLINDSINPNQILKETLIPKLITLIPRVQPVWIDWDIDMYLDLETKFIFLIDGKKYDLSSIELILTNPSLGGDILFSLVAEDVTATFKLELYEHDDEVEKYPDFRIIKKSSLPVDVHYGSKSFKGEEFFEKYIPTVWFADGSALTGNEYVELKQSIGIFPKNEIIAWDWTGINLKNESQHVFPKITNSIQFRVVQILKTEDFDIIYDDDYKGEISDVLAIKIETKRVLVKMYHLKFAHEGVVSNNIANFYEVCGQAQKSIHWKHKDGKEFINHLLRREIKTRKGNSCSRLERGTKSDLEKLLSIIKNEIPVEFEMFIVQPGLSKASASIDILTLLGVTETYIKEFSNIPLKIISNK